MADIVDGSALVVIADEDAGLRTAFKSALEAQGLTVLEAADSQNCRALCHQHSPKLVILAADFPDALGICRTLKTTPEHQHIAILVTLTSVKAAGSAAFFAAGADEWMVKPLPEALLVRRVQAMLRQQFLEDEVEFQSSILSQMADSVVVVNASGSVIYWNAEAERAYGMNSEDILGQPLDSAYTIDGFTPEERSIVVTRAAQGAWRGEGMHIKRSGERADVEVTVRPLMKRNMPAGHIAVIRDVSERKRIEAALQDQRELAEALRDTISALTRTLDPSGVMRLILEHVGRVVPNKNANILLIEGDKAHVGYSRGYSA
ncbi:MAG: PAS domain S-box protein, partial [Chloroflexota bacterium]